MRRNRNPAHRSEARKSGAGRPVPGRAALRRLTKDKRGAIALVAALATPCVLGVAGLAVEVGGWYVLRRNMQSAADAAAMAGVVNLDATDNAESARNAAKSVMARNGFTSTSGANPTTVTVTADATDGKVAVLVTRPSTSLLLKAAGFTDHGETVQARGAAKMVDFGAPPCVLALEGSVSVNNNASITAGKCALASNSDKADALDIGSGGSTGNGKGAITAANIVTHGGCNGCADALDSQKLSLTRSPAPTTYAVKTENAYADLGTSLSMPTNCNNQPGDPKKGALVLNPGCYNGLSVKKEVDLTPGVYYINGAVDIKGKLTCSTCVPGEGKGVSIVVFSKTGTAGEITLGANADVTLNAGKQHTGADARFNGVVMYRHAPNATPRQNGSGEIDVSAQATIRLDGAVVAPTSWVTWKGGSQTDDLSCNVFVVHSMQLKGHSHLSAEGCDKYGTVAKRPRIPRVVE